LNLGLISFAGTITLPTCFGLSDQTTSTPIVSTVMSVYLTTSIASWTTLPNSYNTSTTTNAANSHCYVFLVMFVKKFYNQFSSIKNFIGFSYYTLPVTSATTWSTTFSLSDRTTFTAVISTMMSIYLTSSPTSRTSFLKCYKA